MHALPAAVFGPVDIPPCHLQRPDSSARARQGSCVETHRAPQRNRRSALPLSLPGSRLMPNAAKRDGLRSRRARRADCRHRGECGLSTEGKCRGFNTTSGPSCIYV